jgi:hypothetical protein
VLKRPPETQELQGGFVSARTTCRKDFSSPGGQPRC